MKISYVAGILAVAGLATARMEVKRAAEHDSSVEKAIQEGKWIEDLWGEDAYKHNDDQKAENKWDGGKNDDKSDAKNDGKDDKSNDKNDGKNDNKDDGKNDDKKEDQDNDKKKPEEHKDDQKKPEGHKEEQGHKDKCGYTPEEKEKFIASGKYDPCLFG